MMMKLSRKLEYGRIAAVLLFILVAGSGGICMGQEAPADATDPVPTEFEMILDPGQGRDESIRFSADEPEDGEAADKAGVSAKASAKPPKKPGFLTGYRPFFTLGLGYRQDDLKWSIAGVDGQPNVLSELQYNDVETIDLAGGFRWSHSSKLFLRGGAAAGFVYDGNGQDSDYLEDNRTMEFSRSTFDVEEGSMFDFTFGVGYRLDLPLPSVGMRLQIIPLGGYSYHIQELEMGNGVQIIADYGFEMPLGPFDGLQSTYDTRWKGPWLGIDIELAFSDNFMLMGTYEFHWKDYEADANWNLREDYTHPVSFHHDADGDGFIASLSFNYLFRDHWIWSIGGNVRKMTTDQGTDIVYFSDGTEASTTLNAVEWESYGIYMGVAYYF